MESNLRVRLPVEVYRPRSPFYCTEYGAADLRSGRELGVETIFDTLSITDMKDFARKIENLADTYSIKLREQIQTRKMEMQADDTSHYLIYRVLGISNNEGRLIDEYQNTGRFLYKYAGSFLEEAARLCLAKAYPKGQKTKIANTLGTRPKTFEIDFLNDLDAIEIKWRDATTDGDHITKEHTRVQVIKAKGFKPIRVMFYYPQREQALRIQQTLKTLYLGVGGEYYEGDSAWNFLCNYSNVDLKSILLDIAKKRRRYEERKDGNQ